MLSICRVLWVMTILALSALPAFADGGRFALVINNTAYPGHVAEGRSDDGQVVANALLGAGFSVDRFENLSAANLQQNLDAFLGRATGADIALVYVSGAVVAANGTNVLIAVDADPHAAVGGTGAVPLDDLAGRLGAVAKQTMIFVDPLPKLGPVAEPRVGAGNVLEVFSVAPGSSEESLASIFPRAVALRLTGKDQSLAQMAEGLVTDVREETGGRQTPFFVGTPIDAVLVDDAGRCADYFTTPVAPADLAWADAEAPLAACAAAAQREPDNQAVQALLERARDLKAAKAAYVSCNPADALAYVINYPQGAYTELLQPIADSATAEMGSSAAGASDVDQNEAQHFYDFAIAIGTDCAFQSFIRHFPTGFYADLARAHLGQVTEPGGGAAPPPSVEPRIPPGGDQPFPSFDLPLPGDIDIAGLPEPEPTLPAPEDELALPPGDFGSGGVASGGGDIFEGDGGSGGVDLPTGGGGGAEAEPPAGGAAPSADDGTITVALNDAARGPTPVGGGTVTVSGDIDWPGHDILTVIVDSVRAQYADGHYEVSLNLPPNAGSVSVVAFASDGTPLIKTIPIGGPAASLMAAAPPAPHRYAIVIANQDYPGPSGFATLETPLNDGDAVRQVLVDDYGFTTDIVDERNQPVSLYLKNATFRDIGTAFYELSRIVTDIDTVAIYYAGHGVKDGEEAYWVPADASAGRWPTYVSGAQISDDIAHLKALKVIVISDSCFSGDLLRSGPTPDEGIDPSRRTVAIEDLGRDRSRILITSGNDEPVSDGGGDGHSVFAQALLRGLAKEPNTEFTALELFDGYIRDAVTAASRQQPQFRELRELGHAGGDVIFARVRATG